MDVAAWLKGLRLGQYADAFAGHDIDSETLGRLTGEDLKEIGVISVGHRRKLLDAISDLNKPVPELSRELPLGTPEAERRQLTVMFCDLAGSTALAEGLDPETMRDVIGSYQIAVTNEVTRFDGHVARFMGDGVLAYFGWPNAHEDDAERAVRSGLAVIKAIRGLAMPAGEPLQVRVGIATGLVVVGDLVSEGTAEEKAVVGSTPNLAARLQAMAARNAVVIAEGTRTLLGERFACEDLGPQDLRGFSEPVQAWRVVRSIGAESRFQSTRGPHLTPLIGRIEEQNLLRRRCATVKEGDGQVVLLTGEAGIGKSRIVHALHQQIATDPHVRLFYQCSPFHTNSALYPFIRQLERAAGFELGDTDEQKLDKLEAVLGQSTGQVQEVSALFSALLSIDSGERYPPLSMSPQQQKERTLSALLEQLEGLAAQQPVLVVFEDVHWIDPTSQELLDMIVEGVQRTPALVLITYRPGFTPPWSGQAHVTLLALSRLNHDLGAAMVREVSGNKKLPEEVLEQIVIKTDGIPLFVEELTKTVLSSGLLEEQPDRYAVIGDLPEHTIPTSLKDSLMARLDQLAPVKEVAQIGSVIGREFSHRLLVEVSSQSDAELEAALEQLSQSELIFRRGVPPNATYLFKHALVQDAAYASLLKSRRQQLHTRIAQVLDARFPAQAEVEPELLAHHYTEAGLVEQAVTYWRRAGERAVAQSALIEAVEHFERALEALMRTPNSIERCREELAIQTTLGPTLMATKGWSAPTVGQVFARAIDLCHQLEDDATLLPALRGLWEFHEASGDLQRARDLAEQLLKLAEQAESPALLIVAHDAMADNLFWIGEYAQSQSHAERGLALYDSRHHHELAYRHGGYDPGIACGCIASWNLWILGYPEQALQRSQEALRFARRLSHPISLVFALTCFAMLQHYRRDAPEAQALAEEAMAVASEQSFSSWYAFAAMLNGWALAENGRQAEGKDQLRESDARATADGLLLWRPFQLSLLAEVHNGSGEGEEAMQVLKEAQDVATKTGERHREAELHRLRGELLLSYPTDDLSEAEACFNQALAVARRQRAKSLELRATTSLSRLWRQQGRQSEARDLLVPIYAWFTEGFDTADLKEAKALLDELA